MSENEELQVDPKRLAKYTEDNETRYYVRAMHEGKPMTVDINVLDKQSLLRWLARWERSGVEGIICMLLGHKS